MPNPIGALFGRSPIRPIQEHMAKSQECVVLLGEFLQASFKQDWEQANDIQSQIFALEMETDALKFDIRIHLPNRLLLPVARADILDLLSVQDRLANPTKDITTTILGRKMVFPRKIVRPLKECYELSLKASKQALKAINELDELLETGFSGKEVERVEKMLTKVDELEHLNDIKQSELRDAVFQLEDSLPPVDVIFIYKVIDSMGEIADISQAIGSRLSLLMAR